ncbi:MAG: hypothetical protein Kow0022_03840 [Phycisphaerales bacterium]
MTALGLDIGGSSIKAVLVRGCRVVGVARSASYTRPDRDRLRECLRMCWQSLQAPNDVHIVGLCLPGVLAADRSMVVQAVNLPGLERVPLHDLVAGTLERNVSITVFNDAHATTFGYWIEHPSNDRMLGLAIGTGVGACVLDSGRWLTITDASSGHIGQIDVGPCGGEHDQPLGPDGGRNTLEGYLGARALLARYGDAFPDMLGSIPMDDPPMRALVRTLRICHAIYQPQRVVLLGGVGIRLAPQLNAIRHAVCTELTSLARPGWTLEVGTSDHHAAAGAACLATMPPGSERSPVCANAQRPNS